MDSYGQLLGVGGTVTVAAGDVSTHGVNANGIVALGSSAEISVSGGITTSGPVAAGIIARGVTGDVVIHNDGSINTSGYGSQGILATAQHSIVIDGSGSISTTGYFADGIRVETDGGLGGSIDINQKSVSVSGGNARGIYAGAFDYYHLGGKADINITVGDVSTTGSQARAIVVDNETSGGNVDVTVTNSVSTRQEWSTGIAAIAHYGDVTISAHDVSTRGPHAAALYAVGKGVTVTSTGTISTIGDDSVAVTALALAGDVAVNSAAINTGGNNSYGIYAVAQAGDISITSGTLATGGDESIGILAAALDGNLSIKAGAVTTAGKQAYGIYAIALNGDVSISADKVATTGVLATGVRAFSQTGKVDLTAGDISTTGAYSQGVAASSALGTSVTAGNVSTSGAYSIGIVAESGSDVTVSTTGAVSTQGLHSYGVFAAGGGTVSVSNSGSINTAGTHAHGIYATGSTAKSVLVNNSGSVGVAGDDADAIRLENAGSLSIINSGSVSASGANGIGLAATAFDLVTTPIDLTIQSGGKVATSGTNGVGIFADIVGNPYNSARGTQTISVTAASVSTSGTGSTGIWAHNDYGSVSVNAASVTSNGAGSSGIVALGGGDVSIQVGSVSATNTGIYAKGRGTGAVTLGVTGKVASSGGDGIVAVNVGGATSLTVASGGSVSGAGDGVRIESGTGQVSVSNAGTIAGGAGYAIDVTGLPQSVQLNVRKLAAAATPGVQIANAGTILGAVSLGGGDDVLTNTGTFVATKNSDFGAGSDAFINSGTFAVAKGATPTAVTLLGLESFQNGGLVDLRNGVAGDTLTLPGGYVGAKGAMLGLDVGANGVTDRLVVAGIATGTTGIVLNATAANATLLSQPITLVQAGKGSAANAFTLANQSVGFVAYGLGFDAATGNFQLTSTAGGAVHRLTKVNEAAQAIWRRSADAWSSHMAELRDGGDTGNRVWGQAYGAVDTRHDQEGGNDLGYRQDYYGGQAGVDLGGKRSEEGQGFVFGVTGGYLSSHVNFRVGPDRVRFDTVNVGGYASVRSGPLFANLLGQYDHYHAAASDQVNHWSDSFNGNGYGAQVELGARLGGERFFVEPVASLAWQRTDLDTLQALGQSFDFDHDTALTGKLGGRIGGAYALKGGTTAVFYARASYVHEFKGKGGLLFESGGTSEAIGGSRIGDYGQGAIGVTVFGTGRVSGFLEVDADAGSAYKGGGGRLGLRFKL